MQIIWENSFDAAHRLWQHTEKCRFLHGHTYKVKVTAEGKLNKWGMVADFGDLKKLIIELLDHKIILNQKDPLLKQLIKANQKIIALELNPTAENLAIFIAGRLIENLELDFVRVEVFENPNQSSVCNMNKDNFKKISYKEIDPI